MKISLETIFGLFVFIFAFVLFRYLGLIGLLFLGAYYVGQWLGKNHFAKNRAAQLANLISWSNLVSWLLPPLGVFTASATYQISLTEKSHSKYRNLAMLGGGL